MNLSKIVITFNFFLIMFLSLKGQNPICEKAGEIVNFANKNHYNPRPVDNQFSEYLFTYFIKSVDDSKIVFTIEDYNLLTKYKTKLGEEILSGNCEFIELANTLYYKRVKEIKSIIEKFKSAEINFKSDEKIIFSTNSKNVTEEQRVKQWRKRIKYQILNNHFSQLDSNNKSKTISKSIINQTIQSEICIIEGLIKDADFVYESYLNAIAKAYDPHTNYFTIDDKESFETSLSKETESFGIEIIKNKLEQIEISYLLPGGPAWKSSLINEKDVILSVSNSKEKKSFLCISLYEAISFINSPENNKLTFEISKKNGQNQKIVLIKEKVDVNSNIIQSFVLEGERKIGYIYLPSFYSEMGESPFVIPNGCANDIAKELFKLKREGIEGLIIDVRNNGGGSMLEAVRLSGVFIDYGAVAISHQQKEAPQTIKDMDRGAAFSKPLLVLVNGFSASASEFFAAAMQDQNRAVIVGNKTFGKATMQTVLPLTKKDYLKTTIGKFYRVNGKSHQKEGVKPDIEFPSYYDLIVENEGSFKSALENTTITHKTYYYPQSELPISTLQYKSKERVDTNKYFNNIKKIAAKLYQQKNNLSIPLSYNLFEKYYKNRNIEYQYLTESSKSKAFEVVNPSYLSSIRMKNDTEVMINKQNIEKIEKSIYISEAYNIINDLITN